MRFLVLYAQSLNAKERPVILPLNYDSNLYYVVCRFYYFAITSSYKDYFLRTNKSCIFREQFLLLALMTTYLKDLTQSIGRYGVLSWQKLVLRIFGSTSSISTWCKEFWLA